jgi:hypothetical protein
MAAPVVALAEVRVLLLLVRLGRTELVGKATTGAMVARKVQHLVAVVVAVLALLVVTLRRALLAQGVLV